MFGPGRGLRWHNLRRWSVAAAAVVGLGGAQVWRRRHRALVPRALLCAARVNCKATNPHIARVVLRCCSVAESNDFGPFLQGKSSQGLDQFQRVLVISKRIWMCVSSREPEVDRSSLQAVGSKEERMKISFHAL